ncbi:DNA mismatch repair endonuclease MutL [Acidisphaera sp. L21]|uniref:DNA mismatch repair endonuclease MutL n=1 Tax=Acidisphaera sp. L21 TaxID=1641851 RepID=UPI00131B7E08|nr:DNA mismatch repair endonuclease MutL [Acidisphaera sp. L21]
MESYALPVPELTPIAGVLRRLPDALVDRIAAGEVIERPAAVAKELVENAIDSGARRIAVVLDGGGIARIEVTDDGAGMSPDALALAVQRHCTSKLADDHLIRIDTLGFRGEALPSIGAAARLQITSRPHGAPNAHRIRVEGGMVDAVAPAAGPVGTQVLVSDLFFATPARRNFLKSARVEADHAEAAVRRLAFAAPHVAMRLVSDGRVVFDLPVQDRGARATALLAAGELLLVEGGRSGLTLAGHAAGPAASRATTAGQSLVVNGRPVTDPVLRTAVRVAYRDVIAAGRHAVVALYLTIPPEEVDVNVHPAKTELRFRDADGVRALVIGTLRRTLSAGAGAAPRFATFRPSLPSRAPLRLVPVEPAPPHPALAAQGFAELALPFAAAPSARVAPSAPPEPSPHPLGAAVAQVLDTYVIAVAGDGSLVLVDQHAAHERLTHEALAMQVREGGVRSQPLLLPAVVDMPPAAVAHLVQHAATLLSLGLELEAFGAGAVLVRAMPAVLSAGGSPDPAPLLRDLADELAEHGEATALDTLLDAAIARMACHGSVRAGRRLNAAEMNALLRQMEATPRAATCSHGRPTVLKLSRAEIETMFGRR